MKNTQNDLLLVVAAGAGGAILGLSTLSFYDKPSKNVGNVWTGAAIGLIVGVLFVAYNSAIKGTEELAMGRPTEGFSTSERFDWHAQKPDFLTMQSVPFGTYRWQLSF